MNYKGMFFCQYADREMKYYDCIDIDCDKCKHRKSHITKQNKENFLKTNKQDNKNTKLRN